MRSFVLPQLGKDPLGQGQVKLPGLGWVAIRQDDTTDYTPVNTSDCIVDIERWTAERVPIDSPDARIQSFLTPQWGDVVGFSSESFDALRSATHQPFLLVDNTTVDLDTQTISLADHSVVDITPDLIGTLINPEFIAQAKTGIDASANLTDRQS